MSNKSILILASITIVIIIAATLSTRSRAPLSVIETPLLNPELKSRVNDVSQFIIESKEESVHITRQDNNNWVVMQSDNYPAQFDMVKKLILEMSDLTILSEKTSNPALYSELGVEDHTDENSDSKLLSLLDSTGETIASIIIGDKRGMDSLYVRNAASSNSFQVKGQPEVSADPKDWIVKELLNIDNKRVMEVTIEHPDDEMLILKREQGSENFALQTLPEGRKTRSEYFTNQPGTFLADLSIQDAKSQENFTYPQDQVITAIKTYDGLVATIHSAKIDNINHASLSFSVDENLIQAGDSPQEGIVIGEQTDASPNVRLEAKNLNEKVRNWVFIIPQSKQLLLSKRTEELTDIIEEESEVSQ